MYTTSVETDTTPLPSTSIALPSWLMRSAITESGGMTAPPVRKLGGTGVSPSRPRER